MAQTAEDRREYNRRWYAANKLRQREYKIRAHEADPKKRRVQNLKAKKILGLPSEVALIGHPCDVCGVPTRKTPCADHNHTTRRFRGWVCPRCNRHLAAVDQPGWLDLARQYLERTEA